MRRIGLLGGSFNPAHEGHRQLSLGAIEALGLDELWWLVSPGNPLKAGAGDMAPYEAPCLDELWWLVSPGNPLKAGAGDMAPYEARLASSHAMAAGTPIRVSEYERDADTRYTIDTLKALTRDFPEDRFIWLMGADTVAEFHRWKDWRDIAQLLPIAVLPRPGYDEAARAARAMGWLSGFVRPESQAKNWAEWSPPAILFLRLPTNAVSATALRALDPNWHRRARSGRSGSSGDRGTPT